MNAGTRLDLLSLFILGVASLLLPILGFIGGAVMVHQTKAYKTQDELVALAAIPTLAFVLVIALRWPNDPSFTETMAALADALHRRRPSGVLSAPATLVAARPAADGRDEGGQPGGAAASRAAGAVGTTGEPRPAPQPSAHQRPSPQRHPRSRAAPAVGLSPRRSGVSGTLGQWFPPRPPR